MTVVTPDVPVANVGQTYPNGAVQKIASSGNVAAAVASAAIAADTTGKTSYLEELVIVGTGATAASVVVATVTDGTWTMSFPIGVVAGVNAQNTPLVLLFDPPLKASAPNTAITASCPSLGAGNTNNAVNVQGFQA